MSIKPTHVSQLLSTEILKLPLYTDQENVLIKTTIEFIEMLCGVVKSPNEVFVLSKRSNTKTNYSQNIVWNHEYNMDMEEIDEEEREEAKKIDIDQQKLNERNAQSKRDRERAKQEAQANKNKMLENSNRFSRLSIQCDELNKKYDDNIQPESCVDFFCTFSPLDTIKKPSQLSFDQIMKDHQKMIIMESKSLASLSEPLMNDESKVISDNIDFKVKYEELQVKLNKLKKETQPILSKHTKLKIKEIQKTDGFILSLIKVIKYFDDDYEDNDPYDSDLDG